VVLPILLAVGSVSFSAMARVTTVTTLMAVTVLMFATGWAWPSLLNFAVVQRARKAPGIASGIIGTGQFGGGVLGPVTFGLLVERVSYGAAWSFSAAMLGLASVFMVLGGRSLDREIERERSSG
jgi:predicted MFS family arabinose efflux permease